MTHALVTFLGRSSRREGAYRTTCYEFAKGDDCEPLAFFGWALQSRLQPERLVILGTRGSMWDHLFEGDFDFGDVAEEERLALAEGVENEQVSSGDLEKLTPLLEQRLGCEVRLRLIPYCRDDAEQVELLRILAEEVEAGDEVDLDITHGFRHLPMLGLISALHLRRVRGARVRDIWYGAYDPDTGKAPVMRLGGLLRIADWLEALSIYEKTGDYGVFEPLIRGELGALLSEASFLETVNRIGQARGKLRQVLRKLDGIAGDPALSLFEEELRRRIIWAEEDNFYLRQRQLALEYLERGRYLESVLIGWEAFTTRLLLESGSGDPGNAEHREQARKSFDGRERQKHPRGDIYRAYDCLRRLRNAVAHGSQPKGEDVQRALGSAREMRLLLEQVFEKLLPVNG